MAQADVALDGTAAGRGRMAILEAVRAAPGIHKMGLRRATGLAWGTTSYHLAALLADGRIAELRTGKEVSVFPADVPLAHRRWLAVLRLPHAERVVARIARGEASRAELQAELGLPRCAAAKVLAGLEAVGLVVRLGRNGRRYTLSEAWTAVAAHAGGYGLRWAPALRPAKLACNTVFGPVLSFSRPVARWPGIAA